MLVVQPRNKGLSAKPSARACRQLHGIQKSDHSRSIIITLTNIPDIPARVCCTNSPVVPPRPKACLSSCPPRHDVSTRTVSMAGLIGMLRDFSPALFDVHLQGEGATGYHTLRSGPLWLVVPGESRAVMRMMDSLVRYPRFNIYNIDQITSHFCSDQLGGVRIVAASHPRSVTYSSACDSTCNTDQKRWAP
jgi:hypothetical protein